MNEKTLRINWDVPLSEKVYTEIGKLMVLVLPYVINIEIIDTEGLVVRIADIIEDKIKEMGKMLKYITINFEEEEETS